MQNHHVHTVAEDVSALIAKAELATDESIAAVANLIAGTAQARVRVGVLSAEAHPTLLRLQRALNRAIDSNGDLVRAHGELSHRYDELASGDTHPYTVKHAQAGMNQPAAAPARLRVVGE